MENDSVEELAKKLAASFAAPSTDSTSPEGNIASSEEPIYDPEFAQILRAYLETPGNTKPYEELVKGLTRAANIGRYDIAGAAYGRIRFLSMIDTIPPYNTPNSIYEAAQTALDDAGLPQRLQYADEGVALIASLGSGQTPIMPSLENLAPTVRTLLENGENAKKLGDALKILAQSQNPESAAYAQKMRETVASVIAEERKSPVAFGPKALNIPRAGSMTLLTGETVDGIATNTQQKFFNEQPLPVDPEKNQQFFNVQTTPWVESNALAGGIFADQAELNAAVDATQAFNASSLFLPADTPVNLNVTAQKAGVAGRKVP